MTRQPDEIDLGDGRVVVLHPEAQPEPPWPTGERHRPPIFVEFGRRPVNSTPASTPPSWRLPVLLFVATALSTYLVGGWAYAVGIMTILLCHEFGHYLQSRRYGVPATPPYFIPMPLNFLGTLGAVIGMRPRTATARQLFDIAITGPLAGLVPTVICLAIGIPQLKVVPATPTDGVIVLGEPLLMKWWIAQVFDLAPDQTLLLGGWAMAGWAGLLLTSLNLLPIGQLDGGHLVFTLWPKRAYEISILLVLAAIFATVYFQYWAWSLMILLLLIFGVRHPPVAENPADFHLGWGRTVLGWTTLIFSLGLGFTPVPWQF